jgi:hypothetical protein
MLAMAMPRGFAPTGMGDPTTVLVEVEITETVLLSRFAT